MVEDDKVIYTLLDEDEVVYYQGDSKEKRDACLERLLNESNDSLTEYEFTIHKDDGSLSIVENYLWDGRRREVESIIMHEKIAQGLKKLFQENDKRIP